MVHDDRSLRDGIHFVRYEDTCIEGEVFSRNPTRGLLEMKRRFSEFDELERPSDELIKSRVSDAWKPGLLADGLEHKPKRIQKICITILMVFFVFLMILGLTTTIVGCWNSGVSRTDTNNPSMHLTLLFEHEGCKVHRFMDGMSYVYYTNCKGETSWETNCGKNCTRRVNVPTSHGQSKAQQ
jgi:hypothetical protein